MKRPLAGVILGFAGGIFLGHWLQPPLAILWSAVLGLATLTWWTSKLQSYLLWPLLILSGWACIVSHTAVLSPNDLRQLLGNNEAAVTVRGTLTAPPLVKITEHDGKPTEHTLATVEVISLQRDGQWQSATGQVIVRTPGTLKEPYFTGQRIEVTGVIGPPDPPLAEGLLDYREYLGTRGIYYELKTASASDWHLAPDALARAPLTDRFLNWSRQTLALGLPGADETLRLIWAMTLGWHTAFTGDISDPFLRAGTMHLFAIDGLRIALVSGMLLTLLRIFRIARAACGLITIPAIWFYTAATGWESSAIRASVMMTIVIFGWALKRPGDLLNSLAAAALLILAWDPQQLFEAGFLLSFLVMLTIALMLPPLNDYVDRQLQFDPLVPVQFISKYQQWRMKTLRFFCQYFALSLAAWVGSIPLSAKYFHLFSPISPLANVVAVPLGTFALMSNLGSFVCGTWLPWLTTLFNHSAWFFMSAMTSVSEWSTRLPGSYWYVAEPTWLEIGFYYILLVAMLTGWLFARKFRAAKIIVLAGIVATWLWQWNATRADIKITVLPLNGSQVVFVQGAGAKNRWLINCGSDASVDFTLKPYLRAHGVNRISQLILTTGDAGSCGGVDRLNHLFGVSELYTSPNHFRSPAYREFVAQFDQTHPANSHTLLPLNATASPWQVLHPGPGDDFPRADDNALVLRGKFYNSTILLLSDLGRNGQSALLNRTNDLRADIVIAALPNEGEPLCDALITAAHPKVIIIVDADYPVQRRATPRLKSRLEKAGMPVIYTRTSGAVTVIEHPDTWEVEAMDERLFKYDEIKNLRANGSK